MRWALAAIAVTAALVAAGTERRPQPVAVEEQAELAASRTSRALARRARRAMSAARSADRRSRDARAAAAEGRLPGEPGLQGAPGPSGPPGPSGGPGPGGEPGASAFGETLPAGTTLTGLWGGALPRGGPGTVRIAVSLPLPAAAPLADADIAFGAEPLAATDERQPNQCRGSVADPQALPGSVCLYYAAAFGELNVTQLRGEQLVADPASGANAAGFVVELQSASIEPPGSVIRAAGTWAYTAP